MPKPDLNMGPETVNVLGTPLYSRSITAAVDTLLGDAGPEVAGRCISATGAHGMVHAKRNSAFAALLGSFYLNLPDGMPGVWVGRLKGAGAMERCYGPDFFEALMRASAGGPLQHYLCGGGEGVAGRLATVCRERFGNEHIAGTFCPPFLPAGEYDYSEIAARIDRSGAQIVWIGLGTPKQEEFAARLARVSRARYIITVGAAFDFHVGDLPQAPGWMQRAGLEWLFRLISEPRRLWRRYAVIVPLFLWYAAADLLRHRFSGQHSG